MNQCEEEISSSLPHELDALAQLKGFRLRGIEITLLETFIDAAFAFAVTMLLERLGVYVAGVPDAVTKALAYTRARARRSDADAAAAS